MFTAILSTTVLPMDGTYCVKTATGAAREEVLRSLAGVPHYIGHPDTKKIVEALGAIPAPTKLFTGLAVEERAVCFPIKQGLSSRANEGFTIHQAIGELDTLDVRVITRTSGENALAEDILNESFQLTGATAVIEAAAQGILLSSYEGEKVEAKKDGWLTPAEATALMEKESPEVFYISVTPDVRLRVALEEGIIAEEGGSYCRTDIQPRFAVRSTKAEILRWVAAHDACTHKPPVFVRRRGTSHSGSLDFQRGTGGYRYTNED